MRRKKVDYLDLMCVLSLTVYQLQHVPKTFHNAGYYYIAELICAEKKQSDWLPERSGLEL